MGGKNLSRKGKPFKPKGNMVPEEGARGFPPGGTGGRGPYPNKVGTDTYPGSRKF